MTFSLLGVAFTKHARSTFDDPTITHRDSTRTVMKERPCLILLVIATLRRVHSGISYIEVCFFRLRTVRRTFPPAV